jgi:hypothetical protein
MMNKGDRLYGVDFNISDGFRVDIVNLTTDTNADGFESGMWIQFIPHHAGDDPFPYFSRGDVLIHSPGMTQVIMYDRVGVGPSVTRDPLVESPDTFNSISMKRTSSNTMEIQVDGIDVTSIMSTTTLSPTHGIHGKLLVTGFDDEKYAVRITPICGH